MGLHGPQLAAVKHGHHEAFGQVVQVLCQGQDVIAVFPAGVVHDSPFHTGAVGTKRVSIHIRFCLFHDGLPAIMVGNTQTLVVGLQRRGFESLHFRINCDHSQLEPHRCVALEVHEDLQQAHGILAAGHPEQHPVPVADHVEVGDGAADLAQQGFRWFLVHGR